MAKKELGKDKFGVQRVMRRRDYLGDCLGQFSLNAISGLVGQMTYFYTDKVELGAGAVAMAFLIVRIIDAFTDLIMGYIVDHTKPGQERYRPWLRRMVLPMGILLMMLFTVPTGAGSAVKILYMFMTNFLLSAVVYTIIAVPYSALIVVRTYSQEERSRMGTWRAAGGYVSGMIIAIATIPVTNLLGGDQRAWIIYGSVLGVVAAILLFITYKTSRESNPADMESSADVQEEEAIPMKDAVKNLFRNQYWVLSLIMGICINVTYGLGNSNTYYTKWIFGDDNLVGVLGAVGLIPTILGFLSVGLFVKHLGVTKTLRVTFLLGTAANLLRLISPANFIYNVVLMCTSTFATIPMMSVFPVLTAMAIDFNEYKFEKRMVASTQSVTSFAAKVGNGLGVAIVGWLLALASYDPTLEVATEATRQAIFGFNIYAPALMYAIMFICSLKFDLEKKLPGINAEIAARKANGNAQA